MSEQQQEPKPTDAVLGEQTIPKRGAVLGGIEGLKTRLNSSDHEDRIEILQQAVNYGDEGLKLVNEASFKDRKEVAQNPNTPIGLLQQL
jgi:hypothetical protein